MSEFIFMRPWWLIALLGLIPLAMFWRSFAAHKTWENYISAEKLKALKVSSTVEQPFARALTLLAFALAIIALAGPSFSKIPQPVQQNRDAVVVLFDLSPSMLAADVAPNRLTRARLKLIDLLRARTEGETALIAYADDAYRIAPLTDDTRNIESLVPTLHPNIMPGRGSNTEAAVSMALRLLESAGVKSGDIIVITDGVTPIARSNIAPTIPAGITVSAIGVGTPEGAPIPGPDGGFLRDSNESIVVAALDRPTLKSLTVDHGGRFADLANDDSDIAHVLGASTPDLDSKFERATASFDTRFDAGFWLMLLLVPLALIAFRRNLFWVLAVVAITVPLTPDNAYAFTWKDLWLRSDQQAARALENDDSETAARLFKNEEWQGVANYRSGKYDSAVKKLGAGDSARHHYNRGNALALSEDYEAAMESYEKALAIDPAHANAKHNLEALQKLMQQQKQQQDSQDQNQDGQQPQDGERKKSDENANAQSQNSDQKSEEREDSSANPADSSQGEGNQDANAQPQSDGEEKDGQQDGEQEQTAVKTEDKAKQELKNAQQSQTLPEQTPLSDMSEQWLRSLPQDPGGLMRRKFRYQSKIRGRDNNPSAGGETRY